MKNYLIVGLGTMGSIYINILLKQGVKPVQLTLIDIDENKVDAFQNRFPEACVQNHIYQVESKFFDVAIIASNTSTHLQMIKRIQAAKVLCEKPLVMADHLDDVRDFVDVKTAYLINSSKASQKLIQHVKDNQWSLIEAYGVWGKDRTIDQRPSAGVLEDEMTHMLGLFVQLFEGDQVKQIDVIGQMSYLNFVDQAAQAQLAKQDASLPLEPESRVQASLKVRLSDRDILMSCTSSFMQFDKQRQVEFLFKDQAGALYKAQIAFDIELEDSQFDRLRIKSIKKQGEALIMDSISPAYDKLECLVADFNQGDLASSKACKNHGVVDYDQAVLLVQIADSIRQSAQKLQSVKVIPYSSSTISEGKVVA